jgi:hypothetical protein
MCHPVAERLPQRGGTVSDHVPDGVPDGLVRLRLHLNLAVVNGILFAAVLALVNLLTAASGSGEQVMAVERGALGGLLIGIAFSVYYGIRQWRAAAEARDRRVAADPTASATVDTGVRAQQAVRVPLTRVEVLRRAADAVQVLDRARVEARDDNAVTLRTRATGWTWGDRVVVTAGDEDGDGTAVTITSRPVAWVATMDFGSNARNVERVAAWLRETATDGRTGAG